jgi:3-oxo-5-alpha-steroid 4-dehydrogenase 3
MPNIHIPDSVLAISWLSLALCSALVAGVPALESIAVHGKNVNKRIQGILAVYVPKRLFTLLYWFGCFVSFTWCACLYSSSSTLGSPPYVLMLMWSFHLVRRLFECIFMTEFGSSRMHICGFLVGLLHYTLVPLTLFPSDDISHCGSRSRQLIGVLLYTSSSLVQFFSHRHLYHLKRRGKYSLPSAGFFRLACCPHYTAEIGIYLAIAMIAPRRDKVCLAAMVIWVASNLVVVSVRQYDFYSIKFKDEIPPRWSKLIPGVF